MALFNNSKKRGMNVLKLIFFAEFIALFICGVLHLVAYLAKLEYPLSIYWTMPAIMLLCCLSVVFIVEPIHRLNT